MTGPPCRAILRERRELLRLAVLADVHHNLPALEVVVEDFRSRGVDGVVGVGDYLLRGPFPQETMDLLRPLDAGWVRGNTDGYVLEYAAGQPHDAWYTSGQAASLRSTHEHVDHQRQDHLASLPEQMVVHTEGTEPVRPVHGRPDDPMGRLVADGGSEALCRFRRAGFLDEVSTSPDLDATTTETHESVVICGHTHIPWSQQPPGWLVVNPRAASGSLNEDPRAHYALLSWTEACWTVEHRAVA